MAHVYMDRTDDGLIRVRVMAGIKGDRTATFTDRAEADRYAINKMGRKGCVMSTLDMTPEQLVAHREREARSAAEIDLLLAIP